MRSAPARSASATCSPKRAKSASRIEGASFTASFPIPLTSPSRRANLDAGALKNVHELPVSTLNLGHGGLARYLLRPQFNERVPETGPAHGKTDEPWNAGRSRQPLAHLFVIFASAQNDATHFIPVAAPRCGHNLFAVLTAIEPLYLPHIRFNPSVLQLMNGQDHKSRTKLKVVPLLISLDPIKLRLLRRNQQLEHESAATLGAQVFGQTFQAGSLPPVQTLIALGVVADQHLAEGGIKGLNVFGEVIAVFELELLLSALLDGVCERVTARGRVAKDVGAELLVHQDACLLLWHAGFDSGLEAVVDDLLGARDLRRLLRGQILPPSEHLQLERGAMIEGKDVQGIVIAEILHRDSFSFMQRRISALVRRAPNKENKPHCFPCRYANELRRRNAKKAAAFFFAGESLPLYGA